MLRYLSTVLVFNAWVLANPISIHQTPDNAVLSLTVVSNDAHDLRPVLVAGYDSGAITGFSIDADGKLRAAWTSTLNGSILALESMPDINADGFPEVVASTDLGCVACLSTAGSSVGKVLWRINATFNISRLAILADTNHDGISDVAYGGADHRVTLLNGANGQPLWSRQLDRTGEIAYVEDLCCAGDLNGDAISDILVRTWMGSRWALSGVDGGELWTPQRCSPFLATVASTSDLNQDGAMECLESGNDGILHVCNGQDGADLARCDLGRPIRALATAQQTSSSQDLVCFAGMADGKLACVTCETPTAVKARWTAALDDVCRTIVVLDDIDRDGTLDVVAGAENGRIAAYSGANGQSLWQWQGADVVRKLARLPDVDGDGVADVAAGLIDGTLVILPGRSHSNEITDKPAITAAPHAIQKTLRRPANRLTSDVQEVPILLYHDVPPQALNPKDPSPLELFRAQMDLLVEGGYTCITLDELADWIDGQSQLPTKPVCITFDGQYASHDTHVAKILKERGLFGISYITTDWIGTANHLDWHELRRLEQDGVMLIENHTINHPPLTSVNSDAVRRQVKLSNDAIARHLGGKISRHHAYPSGFYNSSVCDVVKEAGFRTATTVQHRRATRADNLYRLPRYTIAENMTLATFKAIIEFSPPPYPPLNYEFVGTVGSGWRQPNYAARDAQGKLWICDYSASHVRIFMPDRGEAPFSPITEGLTQSGETQPLRAPSGIATTPNGEILITVANLFGSNRHTGLFRYRASDHQALPGIDLSYCPGDVDVDANGLIYVVDKLNGQWHVLTPDGAEIPGSPFGQDAGRNITRGITVIPDSSQVYVLSETSANVQIWRGSATNQSAQYHFDGTLVDQLSSQCGAVDVMDDGTVLVGYHDEGMLVAFDAQHRLLGQISGGTIPSLSSPRGAAFTPDGKRLWIVSRLGQVQEWRKK